MNERSVFFTLKDNAARAAAALVATLYMAGIAVSGLVSAPGPHDNDWPLLMWLVFQATWSDPSPLLLGHYGIAQLVAVRCLWPFLGATLIAAKVLNLIFSGLCLFFSWRITANVTGKKRYAIASMAVFGLSGVFFLTAQSEFGDPIATALFLLGLMLLIPFLSADKQPPVYRVVLGGLAWGAASTVRVHFLFFGLAAAGLLCLGTIWQRRACHQTAPGRQPLWRLFLLLAAGLVAGAAPQAVLNWREHGTPLPRMSAYFLAQVVFDVDPLDALGTYTAHTTRDVLREGLGRLAVLCFYRLRELPEFLFFLLAAAVPLCRRPPDGGTRRRNAALLYLITLCVTYLAFFVCPSWVVTPRLMFPFLALLAMAAMISASLYRTRFGRTAALLAMLFMLGVRSMTDVRPALWLLAGVRNDWQQSARLVALLRAAGMRDSREAFVFNWNRYVVDDPKFIGYYNFGGWNLFVPAFAAQRPNPIHSLNSPEAFGAFMRDQGVRFIVLPKQSKRFPALKSVAQGSAELPFYSRLAEAGDEVIFEMTRR